MNKDAEFLAEAYLKVLEQAKHCNAAKEGCDCDKCDDCEKNQKLQEAKSAKKPDKDGDGVPDWADKKHGEDNNAPKNKKGKLTQAENRERFKKMVAGKGKKKDEKELKEAYEMVLEFKHINKKFARRYNKVTAAMLKAQPGSEEYGVLKSEREDLVNILKDHGQTPKDLEAFLVKKEKENPLPDVQDPQSMNQYKDSSYSDTADISSADNEYEADMNAPQAEVSQMPADAPTPQEVKAVAPAQASTSQYVTNNA